MYSKPGMSLSSMSDFDKGAAEDTRRKEDLEGGLQIGESFMEMEKQLPLPRLEAVTQTLLTLWFCHWCSESRYDY